MMVRYLIRSNIRHPRYRKNARFTRCQEPWLASESVSCSNEAVSVQGFTSNFVILAFRLICTGLGELIM